TALSPPPEASEPLHHTMSAAAQTAQNQERREMQLSVGSLSAVSPKRVPAGDWARKSSPRPQPSPRLHHASASPPPPVPLRRPSVLPTEGLPWCRTTDGFRRRFSYVVAFEVDRAGIVIAGDG
ncbi:unnamed protein product, partial [Laminaria digitata]